MLERGEHFEFVLNTELWQDICEAVAVDGLGELDGVVKYQNIVVALESTVDSSAMTDIKRSIDCSR